MGAICVGPNTVLMVRGSDPLLRQGDPVRNVIRDPHNNYRTSLIIDHFSRMPANQAFSAPINEEGESPVRFEADFKEYATFQVELEASVKNNPLCSSRLLYYMTEKLGTLRDVDAAKRLINHDAKDEDKWTPEKKKQVQNLRVLKCFVYLYTCEESYLRITEHLQRKEQNMIQLCAFIDQQLRSNVVGPYDDGQIRLANQSRMVYRGIKKPIRGIQPGEVIIWKRFTSASLSTEIANKFGPFQFAIKLDTKIPHTYLRVQSTWSKFPSEDEYILMPFVHLRVDQIILDRPNAQVFQLVQVPSAPSNSKTR